MSKKNWTTPNTPAELAKFIEGYRAAKTWEYREKYYNLWLSRYEIPELTEWEHLVIFRQLWRTGTIAAFKYGNEEAGGRVFLAWSLVQLNQYLLPYSIMAIPFGKTEGIPMTEQVVDRDCAIGYALPSRNSVSQYVYGKIDQIVNIEMVLYIHEFLQKMPLLIKGDASQKTALNELIKKVFSDIPYIFIEGYEGDSTQALLNGAPYLIDKLYKYKCDRENELLTFFGIDNNSIEKKERLTMDETNANNASINLNAYAMDHQIRGFFDRAGKVLNTKFNVKSMAGVVSSVHEEINDQEEDSGESEDE